MTQGSAFEAPGTGTVSSSESNRFRASVWLHRIALTFTSLEALALTALLLAFLLVLLAIGDLPMVDLPQHAAQLAILLHSDNPIFHADQFVLNYRTPYWLSYLIVVALAPICSLTIALKLTIWFSVVGQVVGLRWLCQRLGHDPWLGLLGLPLALGYNFLFGFLSYIVAAPLVLFVLAFGTAYRERPKLRDGILLTLLLLLVLLAHGIAYAQALICLGIMLLTGKGSLLARWFPLGVSVVVGWAWLFLGIEHPNLGADIWNASLDRFRALPGFLLGSGAGDIAATVVGVLLLVATFLGTRGRFRGISLVLPLLSMLGGYAAFPAMYHGYGPLWPRFAWLVVPTLLLALQPLNTEARVRRTLTRWGTFGIAAGWLVLFVYRLQKFEDETKPLHEVIATMPADLRIRPIVFEPQTVVFPSLPAINHLPAYYSVIKGGFQGYSFAMYPSSPIRYRPSVVPLMGGGMEWTPDTFQAKSEGANYDCFLVHSRKDRTLALFGELASRVVLRARAGNWWNYCWSVAGRN